MAVVLKKMTARDLMDRLDQPRGKLLKRKYPNPNDPWIGKINPHAFRPSKSGTTANAIDISAGSWYMNNAVVSASDQTGLGSASNPYIVATLTMGTSNPLVPTAITISAQASAATASEQATKRNLCKGNYNGSGVLQNILRYQVGDIHQNLNAIEDSGGWDDGTTSGTTFNIITAVRWDSGTFALQYKKRECEMISGVLYVGDEDASWTDFAEAVECFTTTTTTTTTTTGG